MKTAKQIFAQRSKKGKTMPKNLDGFRFCLLKDQSFEQYTTDGG